MLCTCCGNRPAQAHIELCDWCESDYQKMVLFEETTRDEPTHPLENVGCWLDEKEE